MRIVPTAAGNALLARLVAGTADAVFTTVRFGSGSNAGENPTALSHTELERAVQRVAVEDGDMAAVSATFNNNGLAAGFRMTEIGVFAQDPDDSAAEILFAYVYIPPETADYVPAAGEWSMESTYTVHIYVGGAASVMAEVVSGIYATREALEEHIADTVKHITYVVAGQKEGTTLGQYATAEGLDNEASGDFSHAEGRNVKAKGDYAHAEGKNTEAGGASHAEGEDSVASGPDSHAEGHRTKATGNYSHAEGDGSEAKGSSAHAEGWYSCSRGNGSHAEGECTFAIGRDSHTEGYGGSTQNNSNVLPLVKVSGPVDTTEAWYTVTEGEEFVAFSGYDQDAPASASELAFVRYQNRRYRIIDYRISSGNKQIRLDTELGNGNQLTNAVLYITGGRAAGDASHAEGYVTAAKGQGSHSEGYFSVALGLASHTEGKETSASGEASHAEGDHTTANHKAQHVFGAYNIPDPSANAETEKGDFVEIVGNGTGANAKSNARTLDWYGNEKLAGKLTLGAGPTTDMDAATKKYVDDAIAAAMAALQA